MDKELQKQLAESIKSFTDSVEGAKDFALDQAPDVIHQFIIWNITESVIEIFLGLVIIFVSYKATFEWVKQKDEYYRWGTNEKDAYYHWSVEKIIACTIGCIASICSFIAIISDIFRIAQIAIAPKIFLIEKAASLIK